MLSFHNYLNFFTPYWWGQLIYVMFRSIIQNIEFTENSENSRSIEDADHALVLAPLYSSPCRQPGARRRRLVVAAASGLAGLGRASHARWRVLARGPVAGRWRAVAGRAARRLRSVGRAAHVCGGARAPVHLARAGGASAGARSPLDRQRAQSGQAASVIAEQAEAIVPYLVRYKPARWKVMLVPLVILAVVAPLSWIAALILLIAAPLIPVFMALVGMGAQAASRAQMVEMGSMNAFLLDRLRGLATLRALDAVDATAERLDASSQSVRRRTMVVLRIAFLSSAVLELFSALGVAMVAAFIGFSLLGSINFGTWGRELSLGQGLFILLLAPAFFEPLRELAAVWHDKAAGEAGLAGLHDLAADGVPLPGCVWKWPAVFRRRHGRGGAARRGTPATALCPSRRSARVRRLRPEGARRRARGPAGRQRRRQDHLAVPAGRLAARQRRRHPHRRRAPERQHGQYLAPAHGLDGPASARVCRVRQPERDPGPRRRERRAGDAGAAPGRPGHGGAGAAGRHAQRWRPGLVRRRSRAPGPGPRGPASACGLAAGR